MALTVAQLEGQIALETSKLEKGVATTERNMAMVATSFDKAAKSATASGTAISGAFDTAKWDAKLKALDAQVRASEKAFADQAKASDKVGTSLTAYGQALGNIPGPLGDVTRATTTWVGLLVGPGGLVLAIGAVVAGIGLMAKSLADEVERLDNMSRRTGLAVSSLEALEQAAREAGEAPESLALGLGKVNQALADVLAGKTESAKAFSDIGVNLDALVRAGASAEDVLEAVAKAVVKIEDPLRRGAAMQDIFGARTKALQAVLQTLADSGFTGLIAAMRETGVITDDATRNMARHFDRMADQFDRALTGMVKRMKGWSVELVVGFAETAKQIATDWQRLLEFLTNPAAAGFKLGKEIIENATRLRAEMGERPPPQDVLTPRVPAESPAAIAARKTAIDAERKLYVEASEARRRDAEQLEQEINELLDRALRQRLDAELQAEQNTRTALAKLYMDAVDDYEKRNEAMHLADQKLARDRIASALAAEGQIQTILGEQRAEISEPEAASRQESAAEILRFTQSTSAGRLAILERERDALRKMLDDEVLGVREAEDAKLRIKELSLARDLELEERKVDRGFELEIAAQARMNAIIETRITAEQRAGALILEHQRLVATESGDAWGVFSARFQQEAAGWGTTMDRFGQAGAEVAHELADTFEESFFQLMKGNLDDFDDIWKTALDAVLREIAAFMAAEAVQGLIALASTSFGSSASASSGSAGGSGFGILGDAVAKLFSQERQTTLSQQAVTLEKQTTAESQKRLVLEKQRTLVLEEQVGRTVGTIVGTALGGLLGGAPGAALLGAAFGALGDKIGDKIAGTTATIGPAATAAATSLSNLEGRLTDLATTAALTTASVQDMERSMGDLAPTMDLNTLSAQDMERGLIDLADATADMAVDLGSTAAEISGLMDAAMSAAEPGGIVGSGFGGSTPGGATGGPDSPGAAPGGTTGEGGGVGSFASGGWVTQGLAHRDSVPAMMARGEYVVNARSAAYSPAFTEAFNRNPAQALGEVKASGVADVAALMASLSGLTGDGPETVQELRKIRRALETATRGGRVVGAIA
jgi:hypothetical protein